MQDEANLFQQDLCPHPQHQSKTKRRPVPGSDREDSLDYKLDWTTLFCMWSLSSEDCLGNYSGGRSVSISETSTKTALGKTSVFVKHTILSEIVRSWTDIQFRTLLLPSGLSCMDAKHPKWGLRGISLHKGGFLDMVDALELRLCTCTGSVERTDCISTVQGRNVLNVWENLYLL